MHLFTQVIQSELSYFRKLNKQGQELIISYALSGVADPILFTFVNAFLWRFGQDLKLVALYNFALYFGLPFGFYFNGVLLRKFAPSKLYMLGCLAQGVVVALLVFLGVSSYLHIFLFGFVYGIGCGFFWANRNLLTLRITETNNRIYFSSLESISGTLTNIAIPIILGWFIVFGGKIHLYSPTQGYQMLTFVALVILFFVGYILKDVVIELLPIKKITLSHPTKQWNKVRLFTLTNGFFSAISLFLPTVIVLNLVGNESALGTVQSIAAIISAIVVYNIAKVADVKHRFIIFIVSFSLGFFGAGLFALLFSALGTILLFAFNALADPFGWVAVSTIGLDTIDKEKEEHPAHHYAFVFDQELFLNIGRLIGIALFIGILEIFSKNFALRFAPLIFAGLQLLQLGIIKAIEPKQQ